MGAEVTLSSAQKSRLQGWLLKGGISFNEATLNGKFTIDQLLSSGSVRASSNQPSPSGQVSIPTHSHIGNAKFGIDIQRVDELFPQGLSSDPKVDKELTQIFTLKELSYAQSNVDPEITLTGIFCAKEAIQKASNLSKNLIEIEVLPGETGSPQSKGYALSISHSGNYAVAIAYFMDLDDQNESPKDADVFAVKDYLDKTQAKIKSPLFGLRLVDYLLFGLIFVTLMLTILKI